MTECKHVPYIRKIDGSNTAIVFIHGILGTPDHFSGIIKALPDAWSVYNILLAGHGGTVDDFAEATMGQWKKQVNNLFRDLTERYDQIYVVAHSMGTLFAVEEALVNPKIRKLFLLNVPLKVFVKPRAVKNSLKLVLGRIQPDDYEAQGMENACSIAVDRHLWKYIKWIPNYLALFTEIRSVRKEIGHISVPCMVFQSRRDELVARKTIKFLKGNPRIIINEMDRSGHFHYEKSDFDVMKESFYRFMNEA